MNILFVCSGNTCRSPMAQGYLNSKNIKNLRALSCGFMCEGDPVSENSVLVMNEIGIDISAHKSRLITKELIDCADKIYCMAENHRNILLSAGIGENKVFVLGGGIPDPFGQSAESYRDCRNSITDAIDTLLYGGELLPLKILTATEEDAVKIAGLEKECFSSPWSENAVLEGMRYNTAFFKAVAGGEFAGYIGVTAVAGEGYINNIAVKKEYREKGAGSLLLNRALDFAREEKLDFLSLEVRRSNTAAISLYKKLGFKSEGERKGFYDNPKEDAAIMTRRFNL